jgi:hypothetical protein
VIPDHVRSGLRTRHRCRELRRALELAQVRKQFAVVGLAIVAVLILGSLPFVVYEVTVP